MYTVRVDNVRHKGCSLSARRTLSNCIVMSVALSVIIFFRINGLAALYWTNCNVQTANQIKISHSIRKVLNSFRFDNTQGGQKALLSVRQQPLPAKVVVSWNIKKNTGFLTSRSGWLLVCCKSSGKCISIVPLLRCHRLWYLFFANQPWALRLRFEHQVPPRRKGIYYDLPK